MTTNAAALRIGAALTLLALFAAALPAAANGRDDIGYVTELVRKLYLEPLNVRDALLDVRTESFLAGQRPAAFTVRAGRRGPAHKEFDELLSVGVIVADGKLIFISATGPLVDGAKSVGREAREERIANAVRYLESISAWRSTGVREPGRRKGTEIVHFDDQSDIAWVPKGGREVVFDSRSGLLRLAGAPLLPAPESR